MFKTINDVTKIDDKTLLQRVLKTTEEVGELAEAVETNDVPEIIEETADVFLCAVSVMAQLSDDVVATFNDKLYTTSFDALYESLNASTNIYLDMVVLSKHVGHLAQATLSTTGSNGSLYKGLTNDHVLDYAGCLVARLLTIYKTTPGATADNFVKTVLAKSVKWLTKVTEQKNAKSA